MTDARDAELDRVLIGGREKREIVIADYDGAWPLQYARLEMQIQDALGRVATNIEHIGSASVPGLAAKPIIDVLVVVLSLEDEAAFLPALERAGFVLRVREPRHVLFRTPERDVHVHLYPPGAPQISDYLVLRDHLRTDAADRDLYEATKRELATRPWADMNHYSDAKTEVIAAILARARDRTSRRFARGPLPPNGGA
ncbi:GrpB family protein [Subtercola boreus]|uniref:GrpB family protein n=1 Tax=Subtercola boreus TaxID=120213 RepID=A0A3E0WCR4_9MICO|nr:GrpB family protein [Subtercola boreus]RFA21157.1 hypothetical protein B7R24_07130 [Subtercola boreus]RFA21540.1 hypothetical protein B7R23_07075 [Subtercola boreus]RFA27510.1 hypothetical protein B7R25_07200 [Subtercola boreus]